MKVQSRAEYDDLLAKIHLFGNELGPAGSQYIGFMYFCIHLYTNPYTPPHSYPQIGCYRPLFIILIALTHGSLLSSLAGPPFLARLSPSTFQGGDNKSRDEKGARYTQMRAFYAYLCMYIRSAFAALARQSNQDPGQRYSTG